MSAGCGNGEEQGEASDDESFRVPDSLLSPIEGFNLTVDEYHPVDGGVMANADIELRYPGKEIARFIAVKTFGEILEGHKHVTQDIGRPAAGRVVIIGAKDLPEYAVMTRKEGWYYRWIQGDTIYSEPLDILLKRWDPITERTLAEIGLTQRMAQMALDGLSGGRIPVWLKEAAASYVADERPILRMQVNQFKTARDVFAPTLDESIDQEHPIRLFDEIAGRCRVTNMGRIESDWRRRCAATRPRQFTGDVSMPERHRLR